MCNGVDKNDIYIELYINKKPTEPPGSDSPNIGLYMQFAHFSMMKFNLGYVP